jgi:hypothetical protein
MVIKSNKQGQDDLVLRPEIYKGVKVYVTPLPEYEPEKRSPSKTNDQDSTGGH